MFLSVVVAGYVYWQLTQAIGVLLKTFVRPVDTLIENFILGATEYAVNTEVCSRTTPKTATWNCSRLAITIYTEKHREPVTKKNNVSNKSFAYEAIQILHQLL